MTKEYRDGPVGALVDEHERALNEYIELVETFTQEQFISVVDTDTKHDACRSVQTITHHVCQAGYVYCNYIREKFNQPVETRNGTINNISEVSTALLNMFDYMLATLENKYHFTEKEIEETTFKVSWGVVYNIESLMEHAIVHILRHRRQLEKFRIQYFS